MICLIRKFGTVAITIIDLFACSCKILAVLSNSCCYIAVSIHLRNVLVS